MRKRLLALCLVVGILAAGPACARKNEEKKALQDLLQGSAHLTGVYRYSDRTPGSPFAKGSLVQVRGLIEDDFRYKARLTVDGADALDEVVNDDALAVRFLDPSFVTKFTSSSGGTADTRAALAARYWVTDTSGAPSIGDAAVADRTIGIDPVVDSLSVIDYALDAVTAAANVHKWNAERLDYRPKEDPFPRPAKGSGVTRWDLDPPPMPRADAVGGGAGNANLARAPVFRQMAIYVKNGRVVQIREQLAAKYDLLDRFRNYMVQLAEQAGQKEKKFLEDSLEQIEGQEEILEGLLNFSLNSILEAAGEDLVRFRTMVYEFTPGKNVRADLPFGPEVKQGSLAFFGVNSKAGEAQNVQRVTEDARTTTTVAGESAATTTTTAP